MVYFTYARGYSPGAYNTAQALIAPGLLGAGTPGAPTLGYVPNETINHFEIGSKGTYLDDTLTVERGGVGTPAITTSRCRSLIPHRLHQSAADLNSRRRGGNPAAWSSTRFGPRRVSACKFRLRLYEGQIQRVPWCSMLVLASGGRRLHPTESRAAVRAPQSLHQNLSGASCRTRREQSLSWAPSKRFRWVPGTMRASLPAIIRTPPAPKCSRIKIRSRSVPLTDCST